MSEEYSISVAGIDKVQNGMDDSEKLSFFQDMIKKRPEIAEKLGFWYDFIYEEKYPKGQPPNIRDITYDLLQHVLDKFVEFDSSEQTNTEETK